MLKIKENINIEELASKYGFEYKKHEIWCYKVYEKKVSNGTIDIYPDKTYRDDYERGIFFHSNYQSYYYPSNNEALELFYDLIQAGFIEKEV